MEDVTNEMLVLMDEPEQDELRLALWHLLDVLLDGMDIPERRKGDCRWLLRNAAISNAGHKNLDNLIQTCKTLIKIGAK
jgi:hypothetical protein